MLQRDAAANARFDLIDFDDETVVKVRLWNSETSVFEDEVADRLVSRLDYINRDFPEVLDVDRALAEYFGRFRQQQLQCKIDYPK